MTTTTVPPSWTSMRQFLRAAQEGNVQVVQQLLLQTHNGVNLAVLATDGVHGTALHAASRHGHDRVVAVLLQAGADVHARTAAAGAWQPLHQACRAGHARVVQQLLTAGADCGARLANGQSPLHLAACAGHLDVVQQLLLFFLHKHKDSDNKNNNNTNAVLLLYAVDQRGWTPLHAAAHQGHVAIVQYLVRVAAQQESNSSNNNNTIPLPAMRSHEGYTAFGLVACQAKRHEHRLAVLRILLLQYQGDDCYYAHHEANTALQRALQRHDLPLVRFLLAKGTTVRRTHLQLARSVPDAMYPLLQAAVSQGLLLGTARRLM